MDSTTRNLVDSFNTSTAVHDLFSAHPVCEFQNHRPSPTLSDQLSPVQSEDQRQLLACLSCRPRKIKCRRENGSCHRCRKMGLQCVLPSADARRKPSSKSQVREMEKRMRALEASLADARATINTTQKQALSPSNPVSGSVRARTEERLSTPADTQSRHRSSCSVTGRFCQTCSNLITDERGQLRLFGATSTFQMTEIRYQTSSPCLDPVTAIAPGFETDIPLRLQEYLLNHYWKFHHTMLPVVHQEAFLQDMKAGGRKYFSKALLYAIFACAAKSSESAAVRALACSDDEQSTGKPSYFLGRATSLLDDELSSSRITTVQCLQLLSFVHCAQSDNTKGWMESGRAIRLAFELGLHRDPADFQMSNWTQMDLEVRQIVFWGCFGYDRLWSLYLGRPYFIKLDDITVPWPGSGTAFPSHQERISAAGIDLLDIVGHISDVLNGKACTDARIRALDLDLARWQNQLHETTRYSADACPALSVLHTTLCAAFILLHRPASQFGTSVTELSYENLKSRDICVYRAKQMTEMVENYETHHGSTNTALGTILYNVTWATIVLVSNMADQKSLDDLLYVRICIRVIEDSNSSHTVARTIRKQLKEWMRRCEVPPLASDISDAEAMRIATQSIDQRYDNGESDMLYDGTVQSSLNFGLPEGVQLPLFDWHATSARDALHSLDAWDPRL